MRMIIPSLAISTEADDESREDSEDVLKLKNKQPPLA